MMVGDRDETSFCRDMGQLFLRNLVGHSKVAEDGF